MLKIVFKHKKTGLFVSYYHNEKETNQHRSLRKLKNTMRQNKKRFNLFLTLTYRDEYLETASSDDVRKFINNIKQYTRNRINKGEENNYTAYVRRKFKQWKHVWKVEFESSGIRDYNPHFHLLLECPFWLKLKRIQKYWKYGSLHLEAINSEKKAAVYIQKYFSKEQKHFDRWQGRHWGKSRNMKNVKSEFEFYMIMEETFAKRLCELGDDPILSGNIAEAIVEEWIAYRATIAKIQIKYMLWWKDNLKPILQKRTNRSE